MQSLRKSSLFWLSLSLSLSSAPIRAEPKAESVGRANLVLGQGEQRILQIPGLKRYAIGGPEIRVLPSPDGSKESLLIKAVSPGMTDLLVWKSDGSTETRPVEVHRWKSNDDHITILEKELSHLSEAEIYIGAEVGSRTVYTLRGEIRTLSELRRIDTLSQYSQIQNETYPSLALYEAGLKKLESWLDSRPGRRILFLESEASTRSVIVRGSVKEPGEKKRTVAALKAICPFVVADIDSLPDASPTVH